MVCKTRYKFKIHVRTVPINPSNFLQNRFFNLSGCSCYGKPHPQVPKMLFNNKEIPLFTTKIFKRCKEKSNSIIKFNLDRPGNTSTLLNQFSILNFRGTNWKVIYKQVFILSKIAFIFNLIYIFLHYYSL